MSKKPTVLITGASAGIGAMYADRFAKRGHDLVLVARNDARMKELAAKLKAESGVNVEIIKADLANVSELRQVEDRLRDDARIGVLINNAGTAIPGTFVEQTPDAIASLVDLNTTAVARLAAAVAPRFSQAGAGAIVNIASVVALAPELGMSVYGATKAFVLYLSLAMDLELKPKGVYVQAVLPAATRTDIWTHVGRDVDTISGVMNVDELVDAALVGFDRRETVTIPPLPDDAQWDAYEAARQAMLPNFAQTHAAARYRG
ncbi:AraC family transcriptional regulator [Paraburkholderia phytofirmans OLGA172]|uniref:AraC family transcriptional regulator n=1 Tax=Paraburkholderia phytofirmans OLGA172 TaxID=1417228 RepID=A0A160FSF7_9BURK|nr:SDR family oxidoreductase [Paraburkholderia phytofirmans]ANB75812.1 AraC family transcriptional regulator [Paraburkholderia phytofirmans OLGA172]